MLASCGWVKPEHEYYSSKEYPHYNLLQSTLRQLSQAMHPYLTVSNIYPLGHCLAKCLTDRSTQQINEVSEQFDRTEMGNFTEPIVYAHSTESWYSPSDPTGGFDDCV